MLNHCPVERFLKLKGDALIGHVNGEDSDVTGLAKL